ncbi:uncharacterized protein [Physcomitrium patens]|uniref:uncharacterized protein isoform X1 n=1 Tax=Physcomitrium patens TaxID=3218 RepID=UPI000D157EA3|nr:uncharacterized protein LOC112282437 [Physcomitrium patens]|eukprot:XP_024375779.1 uncharacterized protein LOC112282437 [Physcomitrella patens]
MAQRDWQGCSDGYGQVRYRKHLELVTVRGGSGLGCGSWESVSVGGSQYWSSRCRKATIRCGCFCGAVVRYGMVKRRVIVAALGLGYGIVAKLVRVEQSRAREQ